MELVVPSFKLVPNKLFEVSNTHLFLLFLLFSEAKWYGFLVLIFLFSNTVISFAEKHGTCSYPVFRNEYDYFLGVLNIYFKYNITVSL